MQNITATCRRTENATQYALRIMSEYGSPIKAGRNTEYGEQQRQRIVGLDFSKLEDRVGAWLGPKK